MKNKSEITWEQTGEEIDRVSIHDWTEKVRGYDDKHTYSGAAVISCGELIEIEDIEKL